MFCGCKRFKGRLVDFMEVLPLQMSQIDVLCEKVNPDTRQAAGGYRRSLCTCDGVGFWLSVFGCMGGDINGHLGGPGMHIST